MRATIPGKEMMAEKRRGHCWYHVAKKWYTEINKISKRITHFGECYSELQDALGVEKTYMT